MADANDIAREYARREAEKARERTSALYHPAEDPSRKATVRRGTFSLWRDGLETTPDYHSEGVLLKIVDGLIVVTDEDDNLEFFNLPPGGYACLVRDPDAGE